MPSRKHAQRPWRVVCLEDCPDCRASHGQHRRRDHPIHLLRLSGFSRRLWPLADARSSSSRHLCLADGLHLNKSEAQQNASAGLAGSGPHRSDVLSLQPWWPSWGAVVYGNLHDVQRCAAASLADAPCQQDLQDILRLTAWPSLCRMYVPPYRRQTAAVNGAPGIAAQDDTSRPVLSCDLAVHQVWHFVAHYEAAYTVAFRVCGQGAQFCVNCNVCSLPRVVADQTCLQWHAGRHCIDEPPARCDDILPCSTLGGMHARLSEHSNIVYSGSGNAVLSWRYVCLQQQHARTLLEASYLQS